MRRSPCSAASRTGDEPRPGPSQSGCHCSWRVYSCEIAWGCFCDRMGVGYVLLSYQHLPLSIVTDPNSATSTGSGTSDSICYVYMYCYIYPIPLSLPPRAHLFSSSSIGTAPKRCARSQFCISGSRCHIIPQHSDGSNSEWGKDLAYQQRSAGYCWILWIRCHTCFSFPSNKLISESEVG